MSPRRDDRPEWVVQVAVEGIAVVSVRAADADEAAQAAEREVRPVNVSELGHVEATIVSGPHAPLRPRPLRRRGRSTETASTASSGGRQV